MHDRPATGGQTQPNRGQRYLRTAMVHAMIVRDLTLAQIIQRKVEHFGIAEGGEQLTACAKVGQHGTVVGCVATTLPSARMTPLIGIFRRVRITHLYDVDVAQPDAQYFLSV